MLGTSKAKPFFRSIRFIFSRLFRISLTIFVGVFITVMLFDKCFGIIQSDTFQIKWAVAKENSDWNYDWCYLSDTCEEERKMELDLLYKEALKEAGYDKPIPVILLKLTLKSLALEWGEMTRNNQTAEEGSQHPDGENVILARLPATLLLVGTANILVVILGIPAALRITKNKGKLLDRILSALTPLASVPSWIYNAVLILIFAVTLKWLPYSRMTDIPPPETFKEAIAYDHPGAGDLYRSVLSDGTQLEGFVFCAY